MIFNHLIRDGAIHQSAAFDDLLEPDEPEGLWAMLEPPKTKPLASVREQLNKENDPVLTQRLNRALITYVFSEQMPPFKADLVPIEIWESGEFEPLALGVAEPFTVWLKAGLFTSLILSGPWIFFQIWSFIASGLYPHEQKYIHVFLPISILLFVSGVLLAFYFVFQPVLGISIFIQPINGYRARNAHQRLAQLRYVPPTGIRAGISASLGDAVHESNWTLHGGKLPE